MPPALSATFLLAPASLAWLLHSSARLKQVPEFMSIRVLENADQLELPEEIVVLLGGHEDWPADLALRLFDEGYGVVALQNVGLLEPLIGRSPARTVFVDAGKTSEKVWKLLSSLKKRHPEVGLVAVSTGLGRRTASPEALEGAGAVGLSWPASAEALRQVLRRRATA